VSSVVLVSCWHGVGQEGSVSCWIVVGSMKWIWINSKRHLSFTVLAWSFSISWFQSPCAHRAFQSIGPKVGLCHPELTGCPFAWDFPTADTGELLACPAQGSREQSSVPVQGWWRGLMARRKEHQEFTIWTRMRDASRWAPNSHSYAIFCLSEVFIWNKLKVSLPSQEKGRVPELRDQSYYFVSLKSTAHICFVKFWCSKGHLSTFSPTWECWCPAFS